MIGFIRLGQLGITPACRPVKAPAVYNGAAHDLRMTVHVFGGGVHHDIRTEFKRAAKNGGGKGIVHHKRDAVRMGKLCVTLDIKHHQCGVGNRLPEEQAGVFVDMSGNLFVGHFRGDKAHLNAQLFQGDGKQVDGSAVNGGHTDDVLPGRGNVENGKEVSGLPGRTKHGAGPTFKVGYLFLHGVHRRVGDAGIHMPRHLQVK